MRYPWILLDADGTLFDFDSAQAAALRRSWRDAALTPSPGLLERFRRINGELWRRYERGQVEQERLRVERFVELLREVGETADAEALADDFVRRLSEEGRLLDGAEALLRELAAGASLVLVTNGIAAVQRSRIERSGVAELFSAIIISGEVGVAKPDPGFFDAAFEAAGGPLREEVVIVGDSLSSDIRGGLDYGIDTCWFNPDRESLDDGLEPRWVVGDYAELRAVLGLAAGR